MRAGPARVVGAILGRRPSPEEPHESALATGAAAATLDLAWERTRFYRELAEVASRGLLRGLVLGAPR